MSLPRYPKYKDSGVEWLGQVPAHWELRRARWLCEIKKRIAGELGHNILSITQAGVKVKDTDSNDGQLSMDYSKYQLVKVGDFAMNHMDLLTGYVDISPFPGVTSPDYRVFTLRDRDLCHDRYLLCLLQMGYRNKIFYAYGQGSSQLGRWRLPTEQFNDLSFPLPPLPEQRAIASFLDRETEKIDALVAEQERLIELLKEKRQAVISHAVTKGLNPDVPMKHSGIEWLGDVPQHWEELPLKAILALKHGYAFDGQDFSDSGEYVLMTPGNFNETGGFRFKASEKFYVGTDIPEEFVLQSGQLLVAMTEQAPGLLGSALFVPQGPSYLHNQRLGLVHRLRRDRVSERYLFHIFNSSRIRAEISVSSTGAKVKHTSPDRILSIHVFLPPLPEQEQIADFLDKRTATLDAMGAAAEQAIELLQERRTALISAAVTGQIDVREAAGRAA